MLNVSADRPWAPSPPNVHPVRDGTFMVSWSTPDDGGAPILHYNLSVSPVPAENWTDVYVGTETQWVVQGLDYGLSYVFRVAACNRVDCSDFSMNSSIFVMEVAGMSWSYISRFASWLGFLHFKLSSSADVDDRTIILGACLGGIALLVMIVLAFILLSELWIPPPKAHTTRALSSSCCCCYTGGRNSKKKPVQLVNGIKPDYELATLRELPHVQVQTPNALYAIKWVCSASTLLCFSTEHSFISPVILGCKIGVVIYGKSWSGKLFSMSKHLFSQYAYLVQRNNMVSPSLCNR